MGRTGIPYLDEVWNPIAMRCTPVSPGCAQCWHLRMCARLAANPRLSAPLRYAYAGGPFYPNEEELEQPLHWQKPRRIGVQFMGDWLHPSVRAAWLDDILEVMGACPQHAFLTLTKRIHNYPQQVHGVTPNRWNGISVCNPAEAERDIPVLQKIVCGHRWLSVEPLLEPITRLPLDEIEYVVVGPETGRGARLCALAWIEQIVCQCKQAQVPLFVKAVPFQGHIETDPALLGKILGYTPEVIRQLPPLPERRG